LDGFGERLRDAMLAAGISTPMQLAKSCGVSRQTAAKWLKMREAHVSAIYMLKISECLHVRMRWLIEGKGVAGWGLHAKEDELETALMILERLPPERLREWLACGEKLARA
jgi:transcriptional regulator with XRE-family HTH domain